MKKLFKFSTVIIFLLTITGCSNLGQFNLKNKEGSVKNPLKTLNDLQVEKVLTSGTWTYERQSDDCKDTNWVQNFYPNRYYKSVGAACLVPNAFTVDAESWYLKNQILYVTNLSPISSEDIILRYGIHYLDQNKLILSSGDYKYNFVKK